MKIHRPTAVVDHGFLTFIIAPTPPNPFHYHFQFLRHRRPESKISSSVFSDSDSDSLPKCRLQILLRRLRRQFSTLRFTPSDSKSTTSLLREWPAVSSSPQSAARFQFDFLPIKFRFNCMFFRFDLDLSINFVIEAFQSSARRSIGVDRRVSGEHWRSYGVWLPESRRNSSQYQSLEERRPRRPRSR